MTAPFICETIDSRYKGENKQIIEHDRKTNNVAEEKKNIKGKNIYIKLSTQTNIREMMQNRASMKTGVNIML